MFSETVPGDQLMRFTAVHVTSDSVKMKHRKSPLTAPKKAPWSFCYSFLCMCFKRGGIRHIAHGQK